MAGIRLTSADLQGAQLLDEQPRGGVRLSADQLAGAQDLDAPARPAREEPGGLEAFGRGLLQGATFGFADEISGGLESLFTDKSYEQARNESRANFHAAEEAHPVLSTVGNVAGGVATALIPGGAILKGTGFAVNAARGAGAGILSGLGSSEATNAEDLVKDAAKSGLTGAAVGGALGTLSEKLVRGAPARADSRLIQELTGGRATTAGKKILQDKPLIAETARKFGLDKLSREPVARLDATAAARKEVGAQIGQRFEEADRVFMGVKASEVAAALARTKKQYSSPVDAPLRRQIDSLISEVKTSWGKGTRARVPLAKVNEMATKLENQGFAGTDITPAAGVKLKRDLAANVNKALDKRMAEIQEFAGHLKDTRTAGQSGPLAESMTAADGLKELLQLNRQYKGLKRIERMAGELAQVPEANQAAGGLRNSVMNAANVGSLALSIGTGSPLPFLATKVGIPAAKAGARVADQALARLYSAAQAGRVTAQMIQQAIEAGVPRGLVERFSAGVAAPEPAQ